MSDTVKCMRHNDSGWVCEQPAVQFVIDSNSELEAWCEDHRLRKGNQWAKFITRDEYMVLVTFDE